MPALQGARETLCPPSINPSCPTLPHHAERSSAFPLAEESSIEDSQMWAGKSWQMSTPSLVRAQGTSPIHHGGMILRR